MEHSSNNPRSIGYSRMIMTATGIILLALNVMFVVIDVKNDRIRRGTLLNAFAAGCVATTLLWQS
jgi:succinate dehydrogenase hydrophobic anchor subunit